MNLKLVIDNMNSEELALPMGCVKSDFIEAALHAAKHSQSNTRSDILKDVSLMLNCNFEDLSFLFKVEIVKITPQAFKIDLPDYRLRTSDVYLEIAE